MQHASLFPGRLLALTTLGALAAFGRAQEPRAAIPIAGDPAPAYETDPRTPGPDRSGEPVAPPAGRIERDSHVADRFLAEGQRVVYDFDARAGELALFELTTCGYERGWQAQAELSVLGPDGKILAAHTVLGGTVFRVFLAFTAPADGAFHLELVASQQYFRYILVRHSRFTAHVPDALYALEGRARLFDYLADSGETVRYELEVTQGETIGLRVLPSSDASRRAGRLERRTSIQGQEAGAMASGGRMSTGGGAMRMDGMRRGGDTPWLPELEAFLDGEPVGPAGHYLAFVAPRDGRVEVRVRSQAVGEGGIYDLAIERSLPRFQVRGSVADADGEACAGRLVDFFREPEFDLVGTVQSGTDGGYEAAVPAGEYTIRVQSPGSAPPICVQAKIDANRELHLIAGD